MIDGGKAFAEKSDRTKAREAFFLEFAKAIRHKFLDLPLMVTGGFRTRQGMEAAVAEGGCDFVGIGRPAVLNPSLPNNIVFNKEVKDEDASLYVKKVQVPWIAKVIAPGVGAGAESVSLYNAPVTFWGSTVGSSRKVMLTFRSLGLVWSTDTQNGSAVGFEVG